MICLLSLAIGAALTAYAAESVSGPRIAVDDLTHSFGKIKGGPDIDYILKVFNQGDQTLKINRISSG